MINSYTGMKAEKTIANAPLPAGGYVAKIVNTKIEGYTWGSVCVIYFDIAEGEHKDFFKNQYNNNQNEDKKWKGTYRLTIPEENSQYFRNNQKAFNNFIYALEESNSGYHYDCDETKFKGKYIGVIFRNREWEMNGNSGWTTECGTVASVAEIRENKFRPMKDKPLNGKSTTTQNTSSNSSDIDSLVDEDEDLPF